MNTSTGTQMKKPSILTVTEDQLAAICKSVRSGQSLKNASEAAGFPKGRVPHAVLKSLPYDVLTAGNKPNSFTADDIARVRSLVVDQKVPLREAAKAIGRNSDVGLHMKLKVVAPEILEASRKNRDEGSSRRMQAAWDALKATTNNK
jgi:hypothetical protein